ncbi:MAG: TIGR04552 family protein, partial [Pseudomonadota bacterium]
MELNLEEIERVRLVLRGGAVIDWRRLNIASADECNAILRSNEIYPDDPGDVARLADIRQSAIDYLWRNFGFTFDPEIVNADRTSDLMLFASGKDPLLQPQACMVL